MSLLRHHSPLKIRRPLSTGLPGHWLDTCIPAGMPHKFFGLLSSLLLLAAACGSSENVGTADAGGAANGAADAGVMLCRLEDGRQIEALASFSDGCNCCVCSKKGEQVCQAAGCTDGAPKACQSDLDCGVRHCAFNPGCRPSSGTCLGGGICPLFALGNKEVTKYAYCGCDGVTFYLEGEKQYPYRPYSHVGACP